MRHLYRRLLVDHADFDAEIYKKCGSYMNKKFWEVNMFWAFVEENNEHHKLLHIRDFLEKLC